MPCPDNRKEGGRLEYLRDWNSAVLIERAPTTVGGRYSGTFRPYRKGNGWWLSDEEQCWRKIRA